jgi:hypothetical protein
MTPHISLWVITEGLIGTQNQCVGIAEALGIDPVIKKIKLNEPWKSLSPYIGMESKKTFSDQGDSLTAPWPDIIIASGRKSIAAARYIKKQSGGKTFTVQIQDPRFRRNDFDLLVVPRHDPASSMKLNNLLVTVATPNRITTEKLAEGRAQFADILSLLPGPRIGVLVGGTAGKQILTAEMTRTLATQLNALAARGYGLMITTSRRTGAENEAILREALNAPGIFFWDGKTPNPYFGILGWSDAIIVTSESMSMMSEAATTGKPVYVVDLGGAKPRHQQMQENMRELGIIRNFTGEIAEWTYTPLNDANLVAQEIRRKSGLFSN